MLERPQYPSLSLIGATDPEAASNLDTKKKWLWDYYKDTYKHKSIYYDRKSKALSQLQKRILTMIAAPYHIHVRHCTDVKSILRALKDKVAYTDRALEIDFRRQYQYITYIGPKAAVIDNWIND